jgi:outer membrane protein OmpA-like peptidoglycan-associated protein
LFIQQRAKSVVAYLASKGIAAKRLLSKGFGETHPIDDNNTETGRAKNRRTELQVISN